MHVDFQCGCLLKIKAVRGNCFDAEDEQMVSTQLAVLNTTGDLELYKKHLEPLILVTFYHRALGVGIDMLRQLLPAILLIFFMLISLTSSQSCIRNEVRAALEELENRSPSGVSLQCPNNIADAQIQELNNTMQQGLQEIREELQHSITKELQGIQDDIGQKLQGIQRLLSTILSLHYNPGFSPSHPAHSCKEIYDRNTSSPSGYYWLESSSEQTVQAYCDMERTCGGVQGGWMKVISINMSNSTSLCPSGLKTLTSPKRLCAMSINGGGCSSAYLDVQGVEYSRVCGKIIGYQQKSPDAFRSYYRNRALTIDQNYVDGISVTHGQNPRKHIWTFAAALHEISSTHPTTLCPCTNK